MDPKQFATIPSEPVYGAETDPNEETKKIIQAKLFALANDQSIDIEKRSQIRLHAQQVTVKTVTASGGPGLDRLTGVQEIQVNINNVPKNYPITFDFSKIDIDELYTFFPDVEVESGCEFQFSEVNKSILSDMGVSTAIVDLIESEFSEGRFISMELRTIGAILNMLLETFTKEIAVGCKDNLIVALNNFNNESDDMESLAEGLSIVLDSYPDDRSKFMQRLSRSMPKPGYRGN
jgi:hypothetical protein